jgi:hypothetical protein
VNLEFDEQTYPGLSAFRKACLADRYAEMISTAAKKHRWYENENPNATPMERLAKTFQAQYHASCGRIDELRDLIALEPWVVNEPWTAQGWLPITQAASAHGDRPVINLLIKAGADLSLMVGDASDRASVPEMARISGRGELADYLDGLRAK